MSSQKAPPEVIMQWQSAARAKSRSQKTALFIERFSKHGKFAEMTLNFKATKDSIAESTEADGWLTESQIRRLYNEEEGAQPITNALKAKKLAEGLVKAHPELPDLPAARLYSCFTELSSKRQERSTA